MDGEVDGEEVEDDTADEDIGHRYGWGWEHRERYAHGYRQGRRMRTEQHHSESMTHLQMQELQNLSSSPDWDSG